MNFKLVSFNVRGVNAPAAVPTLRNYVASILSLDVLGLQEHKLRGRLAATLDKRLWPQAQCWYIEASNGPTGTPTPPTTSAQEKVDS
jgi:exonuclease III